MKATKSVLILGGSGTLGTQLALRLRDTYKVFMTYHKHPVKIPGVTSLLFNAVDVERAKRIAYVASPEVVIYAAGNDKVDWVEKNDREAEHVHVGGPGGILKLTTVFQPKFIYVSSCHTFDGLRGNYHETETLSPLSKLGKFKATSEATIKGRASNYNIVRLSPLIGLSNGLNRSLMDHLRISLSRKQPVELSPYEYHSFASLGGAVDLIEVLVESTLKNKILHYSGLTKMSYFEMGRAFAEKFGFNPDLIHETKNRLSLSDYSLNCTETIALTKIKPLTLDGAFDRILADQAKG